MASPQVANNDINVEYPYGNRRDISIFSICFAFILSTLAVGFRLLSKRILRSRMYLDDYLILIALLFKYGCSFAAVAMLYNGLGTHTWLISAEKLTMYMKLVYIGSFFYTFCVTFLKLSILSFYRRLFPVKFMVQAVNAVGSLVILWCFCVCLVSGLVCIPVEKLWNPAIPGGCLDLSKYYYGLQIPSIVTDGIILVMPVIVVWGLQMARVQKILLCGIFMVGGLTLIFDAVRLALMIQLQEVADDVTYYQTAAGAWTCIQAAVGIMAACLPSMRPILTSLSHRVWSRLQTAHSQGEEGSRASGKIESQ